MNIEKFLADLSDYMVASRRLERARSEYKGNSWGWDGAREIDAFHDAKQRCEETFAMAVREAMEGVIK